MDLLDPELTGQGEPVVAVGDYELAFPGGYSTAGRILIRQDKPLPMTVLCLMPRLDTMDR